MASSNSSVSEQDGRYGNSSKQLWKEWDAGYQGKRKEGRIGFNPEKDSLKDSEVEK